MEALQREVEDIYKDNNSEMDEIDQLISEIEGDVESEMLDEPKKEELKPYNKIHFLISFHPDLFNKVKNHLEKIEKIAGVEIEQGAN